MKIANRLAITGHIEEAINERMRGLCRFQELASIISAISVRAPTAVVGNQAIAARIIVALPFDGARAPSLRQELFRRAGFCEAGAREHCRRE